MVEPSIVPDDQIAFAPLMAVVEARSLGEREDFGEERVGSRRRDTVDAKGETRRDVRLRRPVSGLVRTTGWCISGTRRAIRSPSSKAAGSSVPAKRGFRDLLQWWTGSRTVSSALRSGASAS